MKNAPPPKRAGKGALSLLRGAREERSGAVAIIFALALIPILLTLGAAVDYSRATAAKSSLQNASDSAALAAGSNPTQTQAQHVLLAAGSAAINLGTTVSTGACGTTSCPLNPVGALSNIVVTELEGAGTYTVQINANVNTVVMQLASVDTIPLGATSVASVIGVGASHPLEIALALDNTGSMEPNIQALRTAAQTLADTALAAAGNTGSVRVSVVPYVAAVNPGTLPLSMIDTTAKSIYNGVWFDWVWIAYNSGCVQEWGTGGGGGTSSGPGGSSSGDAGDARDILDILNPIRHMARELFGVSAAFAGSIELGVTPNTIPPITTTTLTSSKLKTNGTKNTYQLPAGFGYSLTTDKGSKSAGYEDGRCDWLANPGTVSQYRPVPAHTRSKRQIRRLERLRRGAAHPGGTDLAEQ